MKSREILLLSVVLSLSTPVSAREQAFRIELFPSRRVATLKLYAGQNVVRICALPDHQPCLMVPPGETGWCRTLGTMVECRTGEGAQLFSLASVDSSSPARVEAGESDSREGARIRAASIREVELTPHDNGLRVTATVDLETYVAGVLAGEAATLRNPQALAAMAIVARTWALRSRGRHREQSFDFCSLTHCQFFRFPANFATDRSPLAEAVRNTTGLGLKFHGRLIDSYYSAHCGGMTEAAGDLWPDRSAPYLRTVNDPYCLRSGQASWVQRISLADLNTVFEQEAIVRGRLRDLVIDTQDASGRARALTLVGGSTRRIDANEFRYTVNRQMGWNTLKSSLYTITRRGLALVFVGRGVGHGVGLCQAGAEQMGRMGINYERILAHYFPGVTIEKVGSGTSDRFLSSEHFELVFPSSEETLASRALQTLEDFRRKLGSRAAVLPTKTRVRTWETTEKFIHATGQPGWVAGSNDGRVIDLQPLTTLNAKGIMSSILRHELTHLVVRRLRAPEVPHWYEEGLVLYLSGEQVDASPLPFGARPPSDENILRPRSDVEMKTAYAWALERVAQLARRRGESALWQVLEHPSEDDLRWFKGER